MQWHKIVDRNLHITRNSMSAVAAFSARNNVCAQVIPQSTKVEIVGRRGNHRAHCAGSAIGDREDNFVIIRYGTDLVKSNNFAIP